MRGPATLDILVHWVSLHTRLRRNKCKRMGKHGNVRHTRLQYVRCYRNCRFDDRRVNGDVFVACYVIQRNLSVGSPLSYAICFLDNFKVVHGLEFQLQRCCVDVKQAFGCKRYFLRTRSTSFFVSLLFAKCTCQRVCVCLHDCVRAYI